MSVMKFFVICILSTLSLLTNANCINQADASVEGLMPGMNKSYLIGMGASKAVGKELGEDDRGVYTAKTYNYDKFNVTVVDDLISSIKITSPDFLWMKSIKLGSDRKSIQKSIRKGKIYEGDTTAQYLICSDIGDVYALLNYQGNKLNGLEVVIDEP